MGGGGALRYAASYPGTFGYAGSLSGSLDSWLDRRTPDCKFGDPDEQAVVWHDRNPTDLAANLAGVRVFVRVGDGTPGPLDSSDDPLEQVRLATEAGAHVMAEHFVAALEAAGVRSLDFATYPGSHQRAYWSRELPGLLSWLDAQLRDPVPERRAFHVHSAHRWFSAWGWTFAFAQPPSTPADVRVDGHRLVLTAAGRVRVTAPGGRARTLDPGPVPRRIRATL
jgi:hypothetical protein